MNATHKEESALLRAARKDRTAALIFADYLEEQGRDEESTRWRITVQVTDLVQRAREMGSQQFSHTRCRVIGRLARQRILRPIHTDYPEHWRKYRTVLHVCFTERTIEFTVTAVTFNNVTCYAPLTAVRRTTIGPWSILAPETNVAKSHEIAVRLLAAFFPLSVKE